MAGISEAVTSLLPWLTDAQRFSPQWISAVTKTLDTALERLFSRGACPDCLEEQMNIFENM